MKLVCLLAVVMILRASASPFRDEEPRIFCGRRLANARLFYCYGDSENLRHKSSVLNVSPLLAILQPNDVTTEASGWQLLQNDQNIAMPAKRGGIADECCLKPCYISDLLTYC